MFLICSDVQEICQVKLITTGVLPTASLQESQSHKDHVYFKMLNTVKGPAIYGKFWTNSFTIASFFLTNMCMTAKLLSQA